MLMFGKTTLNPQPHPKVTPPGHDPRVWSEKYCVEVFIYFKPFELIYAIMTMFDKI